jgi:TolC family type I secretion outer membrane protein
MTRRRGQPLANRTGGIANTAGLIAIAMGLAGSAAAESLGDAIALAYQSNPELLAQRAELRALDERFAEARAALGPSIGVSAQQSYVDASVDQQSPFFGRYTSHYRASTTSAQVTANQPIYAGGQLAASLSAAGAEVMAGRAQLQEREGNVLAEVVGVYVDVYLARQLVSLAQQDVEILRRQLHDTEARFAAREVTVTDRSQARARVFAADNKLEQANARLADANAHYLAVVGQAPGNIAAPPDLPGIPPNVEAAFDAADQANPSLLAARYTELTSRAHIAQAKTADGIQVGISASASTQPPANYLPNYYDRSASVTLTVSKPLFTSGLHAARIQEALDIDDRDILRTADARRKVVQSVAQAWSELASTRRILVELHEQLSEEQKAFLGARAEERMELRTTIDVLNAEQELQATKVALAQEYHDEYLGRVRVLTAIGVLRAELIDPDVEPYQPEVSYRRAVRAYALPWETLVLGLDSIGAPAASRLARARDPLGATRQVALDALPAAPRWADAEVDFAAPSR